MFEKDHHRSIRFTYSLLPGPGPNHNDIDSKSIALNVTFDCDADYPNHYYRTGQEYFTCDTLNTMFTSAGVCPCITSLTAALALALLSPSITAVYFHTSPVQSDSWDQHISLPWCHDIFCFVNCPMDI